MSSTSNEETHSSSLTSSPAMLLERLAQNAKTTPSKIAIAFLGNGPNGGKVERQMTYEEVAAETDALARRLLADVGMKKGERAVLVYPPSLDFMIAFLSCLKAGVVAVPVFPPNPSRKDTLFSFSRIIEGCGAQHVLTCRSYNHMKTLVSVKDAFTKFKRPSNASVWPDQLEWIITDKKTSSSSSNPLPTISKADLAFLQYTSGSTSEPKGVMITHGNLAHNLTMITDELEAKADNTIVVSWLPQYHDMGLIGSYLGVLYCGGSGYYMSPLSFLQRPMIWTEAVSKYRATHLQAPNFAFKLTARKFDSSKYHDGEGRNSLDLSSVRHIINGAEPVDEGSITAFMKAFGPYGLPEGVIYPTYGLAEHTVFVCSGGTQRLTVLKRELEADGIVKEASIDEATDSARTTRLLGCGYPSRQGVDVRIVNNETLEELDEDVVGEIWIRSPSKAAGYFNKKEETELNFHAQISSERSPTRDIDSDTSLGYLRTGDLGFLHRNELFICGRLKDLIIVGGRNYYPQDIEATAEETTNAVRPGCSAAFTVDPIRGDGEEVALVLELREVPKLKEVENVCPPIVESLRSAVNKEHSLGISHIVLVRPRTIPKTTSGKIARSWCRKAFVNQTLDTVYRRSFKETAAASEAANSAMGSMEIDQPLKSPTAVESSSRAKDIRALDKKTILRMLTSDVCKLGSLNPDTINKNAPLNTILDSLSISQFKGMLEAEYATKLSDEYLFRDTTTLDKLVEVVKLGFAPDDSEEAGADGSHGESGTSSPGTRRKGGTQGKAGGIAGALGCPPGVVCCVVM